MSEFNIEVEGGKSVRLPTAGKYCDRDIIVKAAGGGYTQEELDKAVADAIEEGKQAEYDRFWNSYFTGLNYNPYSGEGDYQYAFAGRGWNDENFKPNAPLQPKQATYMFCNSMVTDISTVDIDFSKCTSFTQMCYGSRITKIGVVDARGSNTLTYMCNAASQLTTIEKIILKDDGTQLLDAMFVGCGKLEEVRFEGVIGKNISFSATPILSNESVQNIIDHLKDLTGATAQTLTLHADVGAKLTDAQKATITAKNWTLVY